MKRTAVALLVLSLLGAAPRQLDSQVVLQRYALALSRLPVPKAVVYSYTVSQVGANNLEQSHRIYRSGMSVRDETVSIDGVALRRKIVRFSNRADRYAVTRFAPQQESYQLLFLGTARDGRHLDYVYEATPLVRTSPSWVDRLTIDGVRFLPRAVHFRSGALQIEGSGTVQFAPFGRYWMPVAATARARVKGKPAREVIVWGDYRFPPSLPASTFAAPKALSPPTP
ncbi:MAG: hypothetical protein JO030_05265, partial [Candidatus Eremiobacteraeota bacterium]|nr:hypothetical protein [Candidatus Eremiobacteraeota bacterium]